MIVDAFFEHMKNHAQQFVGRRHPGNRLASSFKHPEIVLTARRLYPFAYAPGRLGSPASAPCDCLLW